MPMDLLFSPPPEIEVYWFDSKEDHDLWVGNFDRSDRTVYETELLNLLRASNRPFFLFKAECINCIGESHFLLDTRYGQGHLEDGYFQPNWRERLICSKCNLSNRARFVYSLIQSLPKDSKIWITEQDTSLFRSINPLFTRLIGSEYLSGVTISGTINENGIRHEDINQSSFQDESLNSVVCLDVLEHVPNSRTAIQELFRVLQREGIVIASFPFERDSLNTTERAAKNPDGSISYFAPPEYHGNPLLKEDILCYRHFGWDVIEKFKSVGFSTVKIGFGWSKRFAHLGPEQIVLVAQKR